MNRLLILGLITLLTIACTDDKKIEKVENIAPKILVFSKTAGFRHQSIPKGIDAIESIANQNGYQISTTEDATDFNEENLRNYHAVVFLNTTADVLNKIQQNDFERFIQAGGGFVGVHSAADTEYNWPWYNKLVGAYFESHPNNSNIRTAEFHVIDKNHAATKNTPEQFTWTDEFYSFKSIQHDLIKVLMKVDETTYEGGTNGDNHPMAWYHNFDGGRAFYTALGHTDESYKDPLFIDHLSGGLLYAIGGETPVVLDYSKAKTVRVPDENRFSKIVLDEKLDEPVELAVMNDGRVLFIERKGKVKLYEPQKGKTKVIYDLSVSHTYLTQDEGRSEAEDGLLGLALDPDFDNNGWVYLYYSLAGDKPVNVLTRWDFKNDTLDESSMKVVLEVDVQREQCCHTGGSIAFDSKGDLYLSTGDNTSPRDTAYAPIDERDGRFPWDAQKGSSNTNDLRGKIIRITPQADGTYTIPKGNLFPVGTANTRPEIYGMGMRNPYRISVDQKTGFVYWGDVGPDARAEKVGHGSIGFDKINQMREAGNFGWPYFIGKNNAYFEYDFATETSGAQFDPAKPVNNSPNNTGLTELPPAHPAFIEYSYDKSDEFPMLGAGGRTAMAGPVYYRNMFDKATRPFPEYYDNKLFIYEWIRGWIIAVTMNEAGDFVAMEHFLPSYKFSNPMDMEFGSNGDLYMLEYGTGWFTQNDNARLVRIEYNAGNRKPVIEMSANATKGAVPFSVNFSAEGTVDFDRDELTYGWEIISAKGEKIAKLTEKNPQYTLENSGQYSATLTVTDSQGASVQQKLDLVAGNEPPKVDLQIIDGNNTYFFPDKAISYKASVSDLEDGNIDPSAVSVTLDFLKEGFDKVEAVQGHLAADEFVQHAAGKKLIADSDCSACHKVDQASIGPMYIDVAKKYKGVAEAGDYLIKKIINGGNGVWGEMMMPPHGGMAVDDVSKIVSYILSLSTEQASKVMPMEGSYTVNSEDISPNQGVVILRASYQDKGANGVPSAKEEKVLVLQNPTIDIASTDFEDGIATYKIPAPPMTLKIGQKNGSVMGFNGIDLTDVTGLLITYVANPQFTEGGMIDIRIDAPNGKVIGQTGFLENVESKGPAPDPKMVDIEIQSTEGKHDLYFVFRNEKEGLEKSILVIAGINLQSK